MLLKEDYLRLHTEYFDLFTTMNNVSSDYLEYDKFMIDPEIGTGPSWFIFHSVSTQFTRDLLNICNEFLTRIYQVKAWNQVSKYCNDELKHSLVFEIIDPLVSYVLSMPYAIKQRFLNISTEMLDNFTKIKSSEIMNKNAKKCKLGSYKSEIPKVKPLLTSIELISNDEFREGTKNFRHLYNHNIPPEIEIKSSRNIFKIRQTSTELEFGIGVPFFIPINQAISPLIIQHKNCLNAFDSYWELLMDLVKSFRILNNNAEV